MKKYAILYIVAALLFFGCNASNVSIDGTFEGKIPTYSETTSGGKTTTLPEQTIKFSIKRQSFDNIVLIKIEEYKYIYNSKIVTEKSYIDIAHLYDAKDFIYLTGFYAFNSLSLPSTYKILDNGAKLESINHAKGMKPMVFKKK